MGRDRVSISLERFRRDGSATAAVEFAMLAPLYLLLLMGMLAYGVYFGASHSVQQMASDAARAAVAGLDPGERRRLASRFIEVNARGYLFIDPARLSVDLADRSAEAGQFDVTVSYDASALPIWGLLERLSLPDQTIKRRSTIRIGGI